MIFESERHSIWDPHLGQKKNNEIRSLEDNEIRNVRPFVNKYDKPTRRKNTLTNIPMGDKVPLLN